MAPTSTVTYSNGAIAVAEAKLHALLGYDARGEASGSLAWRQPAVSGLQRDESTLQPAPAVP